MKKEKTMIDFKFCTVKFLEWALTIKSFNFPLLEGEMKWKKKKKTGPQTLVLDA